MALLSNINSGLSIMGKVSKNNCMKCGRSEGEHFEDAEGIYCHTNPDSLQTFTEGGDWFTRLDAMISPSQQTWDLNEKDVEAIESAMDAIGRIRKERDSAIALLATVRYGRR